MFKEKVANFITREKNELKTANWRALVVSALLALGFIGTVETASYAASGLIASFILKHDVGFVELLNTGLNDDTRRSVLAATMIASSTLIGSSVYMSRKRYEQEKNERAGRVVFELGDGERLIIDNGMMVNFDKSDGSKLTISVRKS